MSSKTKKALLPTVEIRREKGGFTVFLNKSYIGSSVTYATAELILLIVGAARWQLDSLAENFRVEKRMDHEYPKMTVIQLMNHEDYMNYIESDTEKEDEVVDS